MFNHSMVTFGNDNVSFVLHFNIGSALREEEKEYCSHAIYVVSDLALCQHSTLQ